MSRLSEDIGVPVPRNHQEPPSNKSNLKLLATVIFLITTGAVLSIIGVFHIIRQGQCDNTDMLCNGVDCESQAKNISVCEFSDEAKRIKLPEFLSRVKQVYYELRPETIAWLALPEEEQQKQVKERFLPYETNPMKLKEKTDRSWSLLAQLNNMVVDIDKLKPRELKTLDQLKHFLQHNFGVPYDDHYYNGDWMLGPNYFCWQPFCDIHIRIYSFSCFPPVSYKELENVIKRIMKHKNTIDQYRFNMQLGVKTGMVRSIEDCRAGIDAIKEKSKHITKTNTSEGILSEWYTEEFQNTEFFENIPENDLDLWFKVKNETALESVQRALKAGYGKPMLDLINYMEHNHIRHCIPSNISSGLASLPVDYVYYDGQATKKKTTKLLPTGETIDGRKSYRRILSYFTTTNISADEVMRSGKVQQSLFYNEILRSAQVISNSSNTTKAVEKLKAFLNLDSQWHNPHDFPENESNSIAFKKCIDEDSAKLHCPVRYGALEQWKAACREIMARIHPQFIDAFHVTGGHVTVPSCPIELYPHFNPSVGTFFFEESNEDCNEPTKFKLPFFLNRYGPKYQEWSVVGHETRPGHHIQAQGTVEYFHSHCGGLIGWLDSLQNFFPAFAEGWALYSENPLMSSDTTLYANNLIQQYGMFKWQLWRALRAIIDTGLHQRGMKRMEALKLFETYAWDNSDFALKELTRYQSCPGQATAYMIGRLTIVELREKAEHELGAKFDLKDFHYQVLSQGNAPLSFLRKYIGKYIDCVKIKSNSSLCKSIVEPAGFVNELSRQRPIQLKKLALYKRQKHYP